MTAQALSGTVAGSCSAGGALVRYTATAIAMKSTDYLTGYPAAKLSGGYPTGYRPHKDFTSTFAPMTLNYRFYYRGTTGQLWPRADVTRP